MKKNLYEDDDFDKEEEEEAEEVDEEEVEEEEPKKPVGRPKKIKKKLPKSYRADEEEEDEEKTDNWLVQRIPETLRVVDPQTKKVIAQAGSIEELTLQLQVLSAQFSSEAARNTR